MMFHEKTVDKSKVEIATLKAKYKTLKTSNRLLQKCLDEAIYDRDRLRFIVQSFRLMTDDVEDLL